MQLEQLMNSYKHLYHASIYLDKGIYFDPFNLENESHDAKYIFITHPHFDHLSLADIKKIVNEGTIFIGSNDSLLELKKAGYTNKMLEVTPNNSYKLNDLKFTTIRAYNKSKKFHPLANNWLGYVVEVNGYNYYIVGDSDYTKETSEVKCDVLFVPIGGFYTMDYLEASKLTNKIKPKIVVPIHYNTLSGLEVNKQDFVSLIDKGIMVG